MQILSITVIEWKFSPPAPGEFRCFVCHIKDATKHLRYNHGRIGRGSLSVCDDCSKLSPEELELLLKLKTVKETTL